jgi:hypothetical protein
MTLGVAPSSKTPTIKPAPLHVSFVLFSGSSLVFFLTLYILLPRLRAENMSWFTIYNLVLVLPMLALLGAALIGYKSEGHPFCLVTFAESVPPEWNEYHNLVMDDCALRLHVRRKIFCTSYVCDCFDSGCFSRNSLFSGDCNY